MHLGAKAQLFSELCKVQSGTNAVPDLMVFKNLLGDRAFNISPPSTCHQFGSTNPYRNFFKDLSGLTGRSTRKGRCTRKNKVRATQEILPLLQKPREAALGAEGSEETEWRPSIKFTKYELSGQLKSD